jgi:hypothetical protein
LRVGLFDYQLRQAKRVKEKKERSNQGSRRGFLRRR